MTVAPAARHDHLYHCTFVKTLTYLTDVLSPDDGGTTVIAGSHKLGCSADDMVAAGLGRIVTLSL